MTVVVLQLYRISNSLVGCFGGKLEGGVGGGVGFLSSNLGGNMPNDLNSFMGKGTITSRGERFNGAN